MPAPVVFYGANPGPPNPANFAAETYNPTLSVPLRNFVGIARPSKSGPSFVAWVNPATFADEIYNPSTSTPMTDLPVAGPIGFVRPRPTSWTFYPNSAAYADEIYNPSAQPPSWSWARVSLPSKSAPSKAGMPSPAVFGDETFDPTSGPMYRAYGKTGPAKVLTPPAQTFLDLVDPFGVFDPATLAYMTPTRQPRLVLQIEASIFGLPNPAVFTDETFDPLNGPQYKAQSTTPPARYVLAPFQTYIDAVDTTFDPTTQPRFSASSPSPRIIQQLLSKLFGLPNPAVFADETYDPTPLPRWARSPQLPRPPFLLSPPTGYVDAQDAVAVPFILQTSSPALSKRPTFAGVPPVVFIDVPDTGFDPATLPRPAQGMAPRSWPVRPSLVLAPNPAVFPDETYNPAPGPSWQPRYFPTLRRAVFVQGLPLFFIDTPDIPAVVVTARAILLNGAYVTAVDLEGALAQSIFTGVYNSSISMEGNA